MILSFACTDTKALFNSKPVKLFKNIEQVARRKLLQLHAAPALESLRVPPGNQLEALKGDRKGQHSIRVNDQWRLCFEWRNNGVLQVFLGVAQADYLVTGARSALNPTKGEKHMMRIVPLVIAVMLTGCGTIGSNQTRIKFASQPLGATITSNGESRGVAPQSLIWTLNEGQKTAISKPITATWISGATVTTSMQLTAGQDGTYLFTRPNGVAGLDADLNHEARLRQTAALEAMAAAAKDAAWEARAARRAAEDAARASKATNTRIDDCLLLGLCF